ncbi:MAG: ATP-binding protein [Planctomycetota bacterium]
MEQTAAVGRALWDHGRDGLLILADGAVEDANATVLAWLGKPLEALRGQAAAQLFSARGPESALQALLERRARGPVEVTPRGTSALILELSAAPLDDARTLLSLRNVSGARALQNELSQKRLAMEDSLCGYDVVDAQGRLVYVNQAYLDMWGYADADEVLGTSPAGHCQDPELPARIIGTVEAQGSATFEFLALRKDGSTFDALMAVQLSVDELGRKAYIGTSLDVSELRRLNAEVAHLQQLEAIGALSAGLAHDFNNMLSPILGSSDLLLLDPGLNDEQREHVELIQQAAEHARRLTQQLLAISRKQILSPRPVELEQAIQDNAGLLRRVLREDVELVLETQEPARVLVDPVQLQQILVNLAANARDAMPRGGCLTVRVGRRRFEGEEASARRLDPGTYGCLLIADDGEGMPPEVLAHVFDPFFTTKGQTGTGLGLASVKGIAEQHGGHVQIESVQGSGTTITLCLPLTEEAPAAPSPARAAAATSGEARVLVVEDNDLLRQIVERVLEQAGYRMTLAASPDEALAWLDAHPEQLDLLLTDVILPGMNGRELSEAVVLRRPQARVLYMSGYSRNVIARRGPSSRGSRSWRSRSPRGSCSPAWPRCSPDERGGRSRGPRQKPSVRLDR